MVVVGNRRRRGFDGAARLLDDELRVDRRGWRNRGRIEAGPRPGQGKVEVASEGDALRQAARVIAGREGWFRQCGADEDRVESGRAFGVGEQGRRVHRVGASGDDELGQLPGQFGGTDHRDALHDRDGDGGEHDGHDRRECGQARDRLHER